MEGEFYSFEEKTFPVRKVRRVKSPKPIHDKKT